MRKFTINLFLGLLIASSTYSNERSDLKGPNYQGEQTDVIEEAASGKSNFSDKEINKNTASDLIELCDLIEMFAPDEKESVVIMDWNTEGNNPSISWINDKFDNGTFLFKNGDLRVATGGIELKPDGEMNSWTISLLGNSVGYTAFAVFLEATLGDLNIDTEKAKTSLNYLFPNCQFSSKLIKEYDAGFFRNLYEVKYPGKKVFWLNVINDGGTKFESFILQFYFDKSEIEKLY